MYAEEIIQKIDGPLFQQQRQTLQGIIRSAIDLDMLADNEIEALYGIESLLDEIADCAHDIYGIDCLLTEPELETRAEELDYEQRIQQFNH